MHVSTLDSPPLWVDDVARAAQAAPHSDVDLQDNAEPGQPRSGAVRFYIHGPYEHTDSD